MELEHDEKELLQGKLAGTFSKPPIILTNKRIITQEKSIDLTDILEVYARPRSVEVELVVRLKDGAEEAFKMVPDKGASAMAYLSGNVAMVTNEVRAKCQATVDRWINLINRLLK